MDMDIVYRIATWSMYAFVVLLGLGLVGLALLIGYWGYLKIKVKTLVDQHAAMVAQNSIAVERSKLQAELDRMQQERMDAERGVIEAKRRVEEVKDGFRRWRLDADSAFDVAKQEAEKRQSSILQQLSEQMRQMDETINKAKEDARREVEADIQRLTGENSELRERCRALDGELAQAREDARTSQSELVESVRASRHSDDGASMNQEAMRSLFLEAIAPVKDGMNAQLREIHENLARLQDGLLAVQEATGTEAEGSTIPATHVKRSLDRPASRVPGFTPDPPGR